MTDVPQPTDMPPTEPGPSDDAATNDERAPADVPLEPVSATPLRFAGSFGPRSLLRALGLAAVGFAATLLLLLGLTLLGGRPDRSGAAPASAPSNAVAPSVAAGSTPTGPSASPSPAVAPALPAAPDPSQPAPSRGDPVLVGAGDIADCGLGGDDATAALLDMIEGTVFTAGDNAYPDGSAAQFRDCYEPTWGRHLARTRPAPGNHDHNSADLAGYLGYFGSAAAPGGTSWYSYDLRTWHIVVLDSSCDAVGGCGRDSAQGRWLAADLATSTARCTLAIWHHPRFSSGEHGDDAGVAPLWRTLYDAGADVVVNGHDHDYERFAPQDPDGREDRSRGIREFVVGTGGAALRRFAAVRPNSELRASSAHGVIRFVLGPSGYEWQFVSTTGESVDAGKGSCH